MFHSEIHKNGSGTLSLLSLSLTHTRLSDGHWESWGKWKMNPAYKTAVTAAAIEKYK